jgi:hypothetical protein
MVTLPSGKVSVILEHMFTPNSLQVGDQIIPLGHGERVRFAQALTDAQVSGPVAIPQDPNVCAQALRAYADHAAILTEVLTNAAAGDTADEILQARVVSELWKRAGRRG